MSADQADSAAQKQPITTGETIPAAEVAGAMTHGPFVYTDGATQVFSADGTTTYTENGRPSGGEWGVDEEGRFWSFWPPSYRATYNVAWVADDSGHPVGVRFTDVKHGSFFDGRYA